MHLDKFVENVLKREEVQYFSKLVPNEIVIANDCNLSVSSYVEQEDTREGIDINEVNATLNELVKEAYTLHLSIEKIINELEG